ncbi:MAG TPA: hypothetical protein VGE14_09675 [Marmoricola sp.]
MRATFEPEHAHRLRESETEWLRQSAARIRAAHARDRRERRLRTSGKDAR